jgi:hypothetical protein
MERWAMEISSQSPWDNVGSVGTGSERVYRQNDGVTDGVGTDDGYWWPCEFTRGLGGE